MVLDSGSVIAIATSVYGGATLLLVIQLWRDRVQREKHFRSDNEARRLDELRSAFYEASGYWEGFTVLAGSLHADASQVGRQFEALIRLECQLRLNSYLVEANNLGFALRSASPADIRSQIGAAGVSLKLFSGEYRQPVVR